MWPAIPLAFRHVECFDENFASHSQCKSISIKSNCYYLCFEDINPATALYIYCSPFVRVVFCGCKSIHRLQQNTVLCFVCLSVFMFRIARPANMWLCNYYSVYLSLSLCVSVCISHAVCVYCLSFFKYACRSQITHHLFHFHPVTFLFSYWKYANTQRPTLFR